MKADPSHTARILPLRTGEACVAGMAEGGLAWHDGFMVATLETASAHLTVQFLAWIGEAPRRYGDVMEAWRTSCPRLSIWEDALRDGLIEVAPAPPSPTPSHKAREGRMRDGLVTLTERGRALLPEQPA
jgi:hypothetical protein